MQLLIVDRGLQPLSVNNIGISFLFFFFFLDTESEKKVNNIPMPMDFERTRSHPKIPREIAYSLGSTAFDIG